jgi:hypothetical protein
LHLSRVPHHSFKEKTLLLKKDILEADIEVDGCTGEHLAFEIGCEVVGDKEPVVADVHVTDTVHQWLEVHVVHVQNVTHQLIEPAPFPSSRLSAIHHLWGNRQGENVKPPTSSQGPSLDGNSYESYSC